MIELGAYWAHYSMWLMKQRPKSTTIMLEPDANNLMAGRANFSRNGFNGEFIQAAVATGHWELDPFLKSRNISHVDVLHVDIQGYEADFLAGARESLAQAAVDYLFISTHSQLLHQRIKEELAGSGYRIEVSGDFDDETTSYDGLIFASSPQAKRVFSEFPYIGRTGITVSRAEQLVQALLKVGACTL